MSFSDRGPRGEARGWFRLALALILLAAAGSTARAQYAWYYYPYGYADWGWSGWGTGGAATAQGDIARGLGAFAQGAAAAQEQAARARAINATTIRRWNDYLYQAQQNSSRRYYDKLARSKESNARSRAQVYRRLRENPTASDIARGDALNVALDEINDPRLFSAALKNATATLPGTLIRDIPFQYASAAITTSVEHLVKGGPPAALKRDAFRAEREALKETAAEIRKQNEDGGSPDPATLERARTQLKALWAKVETTYERNTPERRDSEKWIKAAFGLTKMLESPAVDVLLAGVEKRPDTTLRDLLLFMDAFNLRFGAATTKRQKEVYNTLHPILVKLRDRVVREAPDISQEVAPPDDETRPEEFFQGMDVRQLESKRPANGARSKSKKK